MRSQHTATEHCRQRRGQKYRIANPYTHSGRIANPPERGGVAALEGLLVTLLLIAASFVANILAGVITLGMIRKNKA